MICRQCGAVLSALFLLCMVFKSEIRVSKQYLRPVAPSIAHVDDKDFPPFPLGAAKRGQKTLLSTFSRNEQVNKQAVKSSCNTN